MLNDLHRKPLKKLVFPHNLKEMHEIQAERDNFFQNTLDTTFGLELPRTNNAQIISPYET